MGMAWPGMKNHWLAGVEYSCIRTAFGFYQAGNGIFWIVSEDKDSLGLSSMFY